jgi:hypothetical protein
MQITAAKLFLVMTTRTQSVHRLATLIHPTLILLSSSYPTWVNMKVAHEAAARGLLNMLHGAEHPATRSRHPILLDTLAGTHDQCSQSDLFLRQLSKGKPFQYNCCLPGLERAMKLSNAATAPVSAPDHS